MAPDYARILSEIAEEVLAPSKTPWQQVLASHIRRAVAAKTGAFDIDRSRRHLDGATPADACLPIVIEGKSRPRRMHEGEVFL